MALLAGTLLAGCSSQGPQEKLEKAAEDASSAVRSSRLAFGLLDEGRTTRAQVKSVLIDMTTELSTAGKTVLETPSAQEAGGPATRDDVLRAVQAAGLAVAAGRDCVETESGCGPASDRLRAADEQLKTVQDRLAGGS